MRPAKKPMNKNLNVRLDVDTLMLFEIAADLDERTVSDWARVVLRREANKIANEVKS